MRIRNVSSGEFLYTGSKKLDPSRRHALTWCGEANDDPAMLWEMIEAVQLHSLESVWTKQRIEARKGSPAVDSRDRLSWDAGLGLTWEEHFSATKLSSDAVNTLFVALQVGHEAVVDAIVSRHLDHIDCKPFDWICGDEHERMRAYPWGGVSYQGQGAFRSRSYWWRGATPLMLATAVISCS